MGALQPHTIVKHLILRRYLQAWYPILSRSVGNRSGEGHEILYLDGFAGPGVYVDGTPGSPAIALDVFLDHPTPLPVPVRAVFVERSRKKWRSLRTYLDTRRQAVEASGRVLLGDPVNEDSTDTIDQLLQAQESGGKGYSAAFLFLDQFGYSQVPIELIGRAMRNPSFETFVLVHYRNINRFLSDRTKWPGVTRLYGGERWKPALRMRPAEREPFLLAEYEAALKEDAAVRHVFPYRIADRGDKPLHWLVFCTNNLHGLREMKQSMMGVNPEGGFRFSDRRGLQGSLFDKKPNTRELAAVLATQLAGQTLSVGQIEAFVLEHTSSVTFKRALALLRKEGKIAVPNALPDWNGSFSDEYLLVRFQ